MADVNESTPPGLPSHLRLADKGGSGDWLPQPEPQIRYYTNAFVIQGDKLLLGYKKRGLGIHKYNGFGGKVEAQESTLDAALRELKEEAGISAPLEHAGTLLFVVAGDKWAHIDIFRAEEYSGVVTESEEMRPEWFSKEMIPWDTMWATDRHWLPFLLDNQRFSVRADFERQGEQFILRRWWVGIDSQA